MFDFSIFYNKKTKAFIVKCTRAFLLHFLFNVKNCYLKGYRYWYIYLYFFIQNDCTKCNREAYKKKKNWASLALYLYMYGYMTYISLLFSRHVTTRLNQTNKKDLKKRFIDKENENTCESAAYRYTL